MPDQKIKILGIDPGYERLGVAVIEKCDNQDHLLHSDCIKTSSKQNHSTRLLTIGDELSLVINHYQPNYLAIETLFFNKNQKTALYVAEARGVVLQISASHLLEIVELSPLQIKQAITGYGRGTKNQIIKMIPQLIKLNKTPRYDDEYDAIAIALTAGAMIKSQL